MSSFQLVEHFSRFRGVTKANVDLAKCNKSKSLEKERNPFGGMLKT